MADLQVTGKQTFMGQEIPVVLGGFGENQRCMADKTIAEIHGMEAFNVRARITDNIKRFAENVDVIDLGQRLYQAKTSSEMENIKDLLIKLGYSKQAITQAEHIYILSKRGYLKLIKIMDSDLAWEIYEQLVDEYFTLRKKKKQQVVKTKSESLASVNNAVKILTPILDNAGCGASVQLLTVKALYEKAGVLLPVEIKADKQYKDTKQIARECGMFTRTNNPAHNAAGEIIRKLDPSEDHYTDAWETNGSWQGTVRKYDDFVVDEVRRWIAEHNYPEKIDYVQNDGVAKQYHVIYRANVKPCEKVR